MAEDLEPIGRRLKAAREASGLVVDDVVFRTRLPRSVVEALEAGDFSVFNSPLYAKSFLSQYSGFLNVDAQPWIDALEPVGFMPGGLLQPVIRPLAAPVAAKPVDPDLRGGWQSVLGLFALSAALVYLAVRGYDFFESRFGAEHHPQVESVVPAARPPVVAPVKPREWKPAVVREDEELGKPAPRAIIVR